MRRQQAASFTAELSLKMRKFNEESEAKLDKASSEWAEERSNLLLLAEEAKMELESRLESSEGVLRDFGLRQCRRLVGG